MAIKTVEAPPRDLQDQRVFRKWLQQQVQRIISQKTDIQPGAAGSLASFSTDGNLNPLQKTVPQGDVVGTSDAQTLSNKTLSAPAISDFSQAQHNHHDVAGGGKIDEGSLNLSDVSTGNASKDRHGLLPKLSDSDDDFLNGKGIWTPGYTGTLTVVADVGPPLVTKVLTFKGGQLVGIV